MADRRVKVVFSAEIQGFKRAMEEAAQATKKTQKASEESSKAADTYLGRMVQSANKNREAWDTAGATMMGFGAAAVGGLALAGKAAVDWESAWAGVTKTVDGTPAQMDELEESLRGLAKTLPATHEEIAGVAEAAGQLGVAREDVTGFTKTMVDLGETTNLSADEAATAIAQISNVMGTMEREGSEGVERFGATLVALGNAGASTEAEIVDMAKRIAGAGKLVGASESDVLALANAMASVGIEAQLGGGVISRVMQRMYGDVKEGGEGLDNLAKVAGVSSKEFAAAFETDPVRAVDMMVKGFGRIKDEGGNVIDTMADLGIKGTEETSVLLRLAGAGDLLTDSLKLGDEAWQSNSALAAEAAKRYETTESKVKIAWNNIKDAAIDAGAILLPIISGVAESAAGMAQAFGSLPDPVKGALTVLGGVAGVAALGAGAFLTLTPRILDSLAAFDKLAPAGGRARGAIAGVGKAAGAATAAIVGFEIIKGLHNSMEAPTASLEKFTQALVGIDKEKGALDSLFADIGAKEFEGDISSAGDALNKLINQDFNSAIESFGASALGIDNGMSKLADGITKVDQSIASAVGSGDMDLAAKGFKSIAESADEQGISLEKVGERFPEYLDSLRKLASDSKVTLTEQELLNWAMGETPAAMEAAAAGANAAATGIEAAGDASAGAVAPSEEVAEALAEIGVSADGTVTDLVKFTDALINAGLLQLSARDAARNFQAAIDGVDESIKTNGTSLDIHTEKGRANQAALDAIAGAGFNVVKANAANGDSQKSLQGNLRTTYDSLITAAGGFGITGDKAIALVREVLKVPKGVSIDSWMSSEAKRMAEQTAGALNSIDGRVVRTYAVHRNTTIHETIQSSSVQTGQGTADRRTRAYATGGRLPGYADGGQLPTSGPGTETTDGFLGISSAGVPLARVDAGEWIINRGSSGRYNRELAAINAGTFPKLPGYATGGMFSAGAIAGSSGRGSQGVDSGAVADAVAGAMAGWQPVVSIGGREFYGLMADSTAKARRR